MVSSPWSSLEQWTQRKREGLGVQDHEAPYFSNMRRRQSRKDSDLNGVVDVRYTGGARMLLLLVVGQGRWRFKVGPTSRLSRCPSLLAGAGPHWP